MQHPMERLQDLHDGALQCIALGDLQLAEQAIVKAIEVARTIPLAPWNPIPVDLEDDSVIVNCEFEDVIVFAADPYFNVRSAALHNQLRQLGIQDGARIVLDLLCANGSSSRFFEGVFSYGYGIQNVKVVPLEQWDEMRELHARPLAHYHAGGQLNTTLLTASQTYALKKGIAFPIRR